YPRLDFILSGVAEGWLVADRLAREDIPVIAVPMYNLPGSFESIASTQSNVGRMRAAGIRVAIADPGQPRLMTQQAGQTVAQARIPGATGMTRDQALAAITSVPAAILGLNVGSIAPGKQADIVIWDGDPIELSTAPTAVYIGGVAQPMDSRQTKLRDRYNPANPDTGLPKQYSR
ncbi:MAG: amidohydrolase family protein, partial [Pacificimonas sp.]